MPRLSASALRSALDRRSFLKCALASGAALGRCGDIAVFRACRTRCHPAASASEDDARFVVEAKFYQKLPNRKIKCKLCPRECTVGDKERGYCGVRENRGGTYYTLVHSRVCAAHVDPIEKKPLFHYLPGTTAFSIATAGCNVNCKFCQNWDISQSRPEEVPAQYLPAAERCRIGQPIQLPHHRLHLQRAGDLRRIPDGCRRCGARSGRAQHCGVERLHAGGLAEGRPTERWMRSRST